MRKIFKNLLPYKNRILLALFLTTAATVCDLMLPTIMSSIVDKGIYLSDMDYIKKSCLIMFLTTAAGFTTIVLGQKFTNEVVFGFTADLRRLVFKKVNSMTFSEMSELGTAALVTRSTHDTETLGWIAGTLCSGIITIPVLFIGGIALSLSKDALLSIILLCFVPIVFIVVIAIGKKIEPLYRIADEYIDKQNDIMRERIRGIRVIRAFGNEEKEHGRIVKAINVMTVNLIKSNVSMGIITPLSMFMLNFSIVLILCIGAFRMENGISTVSAGDIFAVIQYVTLVMNSVISIAYVIVAAPQAKVAAERIGEVLSAEGFDDKIAEEKLEFNGNIEFDHVTFKYDGAVDPAVEDICLSIKSGQKVSVIGGTGSGKSTLVSLMLCFRMPTSGKVLFDGRSTETLSHRTVRRNISCVLQNSSIYSGTIKENIEMGKPGASDDEIREAADIAELSSFIGTLEKGFDHELNQSGKNLSGGQKQRLSIARAIIKNAPIYIFDDSFSALDFLTEAKLRKKLSEKANGKTQIIVTQRITSAMNSDVIFVMNNGKLVGYGKHSELLENCDIYREIYDSQTGGDKK